MGFLLNGSTASLAPYSQVWEDVIQGRDHLNRPIYAATKNAVLEFDFTTYANYNQWAQFHGASLTSITLLNIDTAASYTTYSNANIFLELSQRPKQEAQHIGPFTIRIVGITP